MFQKIIKEPLLHFLLIGVVLFVINYTINIKKTATDVSNEIVVEPATVEKIKTQYQQFTGIAATKSEVDSFINNYIIEEIIYREALKTGLDKSDETRTALIKQMKAVNEAMINIPVPSTKQLEEYYNNNAATFTYLLSDSLTTLPPFKQVEKLVTAKFIEAQKQQQVKQKENALKAQYKIINQYKQP